MDEITKQITEQIIAYLTDPSLIPSPYYQIIIGIKILFIGISIFFIVLSIYILMNTQWLKFRYTQDISEFSKFKSYEFEKFAKDWKKIMKRLETGLESEYKLAIIEADVMLEQVLERMGHIEPTIEEKINKVTPSDIPSVNELKVTREIRNDVIHDPDYDLSQEKSKEVLSVYEKAFKELNILS